MMELNTSNIIMLVLIILVIAGTSYLYLEMKQLKSVVNNNTQNIKSINNAIVNMNKLKKPTSTAPRPLYKSEPPPINKNLYNKVGPIKMNQVSPPAPKSKQKITEVPESTPERHPIFEPADKKETNDKLLSESDKNDVHVDEEDTNLVSDFLKDIDDDKSDNDESEKHESDGSDDDKSDDDDGSDDDGSDDDKSDDDKSDNSELLTEDDNSDNSELLAEDDKSDNSELLTEDMLNEMSVKELRELSSKRGLIKSGTKNILIERLLK